jgi:hypothetical protein
MLFSHGWRGSPFRDSVPSLAPEYLVSVSTPRHGLDHVPVLRNDVSSSSDYIILNGRFTRMNWETSGRYLL